MRSAIPGTSTALGAASRSSATNRPAPRPGRTAERGWAVPSRLRAVSASTRIEFEWVGVTFVGDTGVHNTGFQGVFAAYATAVRPESKRFYGGDRNALYTTRSKPCV